jgi:hypothetical protein
MVWECDHSHNTYFSTEQSYIFSGRESLNVMTSVCFQFSFPKIIRGSWKVTIFVNSLSGTATRPRAGYRWPGKDKTFLSSPERADRSERLTTHLRLVSALRICGVIPLHPICLHGAVSVYAQGTCFLPMKQKLVCGKLTGTLKTTVSGRTHKTISPLHKTFSPTNFVMLVSSQRSQLRTKTFLLFLIHWFRLTNNFLQGNSVIKETPLLTATISKPRTLKIHDSKQCSSWMRFISVFLSRLSP